MTMELICKGQTPYYLFGGAIFFALIGLVCFAGIGYLLAWCEK